MPPIFPILAIFAVILFISTHASSQPKKEKASPSKELADAIEKIMKASGSKDKD